MKLDLAMLISLLLALVCVLGGLWLVPRIAGSQESPWPQLGVGLGWVIYRVGWQAWKVRSARQ